MPRTESNPIHLGAPAPDFLLPDADGRLHRLEDFAAKPALLVAFISNRCPFVVLIREELARIGRDYAEEGFAIVAINANDAATHPEETLARIGRGGQRARLRLSLPQGRRPVGRQGLRRRLHARPLPLRR